MHGTRWLRLWEVRKVYGQWDTDVQECIVLLRLSGWSMLQRAPDELQPELTASSFHNGKLKEISREAAALIAQGEIYVGTHQAGRASREDLALLLQSRLPEVRQVAIRLAGRVR